MFFCLSSENGHCLNDKAIELLLDKGQSVAHFIANYRQSSLLGNNTCGRLRIS